MTGADLDERTSFATRLGTNAALSLVPVDAQARRQPEPSKGEESRRMKFPTAGVCLVLGLAAAAPARAQSFLPFSFGALPIFAWPDPARSDRWEGGYGRMSTGFVVASSRRSGTVAGPTIGVEAGHYWRQGDLVLGVAGGFDYLAPFGGSGLPSFGRFAATRDFAGGFQVKAGTLVRDDLFVYVRAGVAGINETIRFGGSPIRPGWSRSDIVVQPNAGVGVEWAVTEQITLGLEVNAAGAAIR